jgi:hypothetical protein
LTKNEDKKTILTPEFEEALELIRHAEERISELKDKAKSMLEETFKENKKLSKIEGEKVSVGFVTRRYKKIADPEKVDPKYKKMEWKPNTKAVNIFQETTGKLPEGITESKTSYVTFKALKKADEK